MSRYITIPRAMTPATPDHHWDKGPMAISVTVDDAKMVDTGLVDAGGNAIMRVQPPIGFGRDHEH